MQASEEARLEDLEGLVWEMIEAAKQNYPKAQWIEWLRRYSVAGLDEESAEAEWPEDKPERDDDAYSAYKDDRRKKCYVCGEEKPLSEFYRRAASADGRQRFCRECEKKIVRQHQQSKKHDAKYASLVEQAEQRTREVYR